MIVSSHHIFHPSSGEGVEAFNAAVKDAMEDSTKEEPAKSWKRY